MRRRRRRRLRKQRKRREKYNRRTTGRSAQRKPKPNAKRLTRRIGKSRMLKMKRATRIRRSPV